MKGTEQSNGAVLAEGTIKVYKTADPEKDPI